MIDLSDWPAGVKIAVLITPFLTGLTGIGISAHIASSRHFDLMCEALQRSKCLHDELRRGGGVTLKLRLMTVGAIAGVLIWPELSIRRGDLDSEDYQNFPSYLKRRIRAAIVCVYVSLAWAAVIELFVELKRT